MANELIKVGIIGLGAIGTRLLDQFIAHHSTEVTAICDVSAERAKEVSERYTIPDWHTDYKRLIRESNTDIIYVAVPPKYHYEVVKDVLDAGKHVFCEKPLANSIEEANAMYEQAERMGLVHAMNFPMNYSPGAKTLHEMVSAGYIGQLRKLELQLQFPQWPRAWQQNQWVASREQGGFILEVGIHYIQLIQRIFGNINDVQSMIEWPEDPQASEVGILATMTLENGTPMLINGISHVAGEERIALTAYGTEGTLSLVNWRELEGGKIGEPIREIQLDENKAESIITNIVNRLKGDIDNTTIIGFDEGVKAQVVLEALRKG